MKKEEEDEEKEGRRRGRRNKGLAKCFAKKTQKDGHLELLSTPKEA